MKKHDIFLPGHLSETERAMCYEAVHDAVQPTLDELLEETAQLLERESETGTLPELASAHGKLAMSEAWKERLLAVMKKHDIFLPGHLSETEREACYEAVRQAGRHTREDAMAILDEFLSDGKEK